MDHNYYIPANANLDISKIREQAQKDFSKDRSGSIFHFHVYGEPCESYPHEDFPKREYTPDQIREPVASEGPDFPYNPDIFELRARINWLLKHLEAKDA